MDSTQKRLLDDCISNLSLLKTQTKSLDGAETFSSLTDCTEDRQETCVNFTEVIDKKTEQSIGSEFNGFLINLGPDLSKDQHKSSSQVLGETSGDFLPARPIDDNALEEMISCEGWAPAVPPSDSMVSEHMNNQFCRDMPHGGNIPEDDGKLLQTPLTLHERGGESSSSYVAGNFDNLQPSRPHSKGYGKERFTNDYRGTRLHLLGSTKSVFAQPEIIHIPRTEQPALPPTQDCPPGITFLDVPWTARVQDIIGLIRTTTGCRIRLVNLKHSEKLGKLFFADWPAHESFLDDARRGLIKVPWNNSLDISVNPNDRYNPELDGEGLANGTRILRIRNLPEQTTLDIILTDLIRAAGVWTFCIEKAVLFKEGNNLGNLTAQLNFTSIRGAVMAKDCFRGNGENVAKYGFTEITFAADERSSEYEPPQTGTIIDWRGLRAGSRLPAYLLPNGYMRLNRPNVLPQFLPPFSRSRAVDIGPARISNPPKYPPHGLYFKELPNDITYSKLLTAIRGGKILQANIFNPKLRHQGRFRSAAVFFVEKEDADNVLEYLTGKGGLCIPGLGESPGTRYVVARYVTNNAWEQVALPPFASRCVSLCFVDTPDNKNVTAGNLWSEMMKSAIFMHAETMLETPYIKTSPSGEPIRFRQLRFNLISIEMAAVAFSFVKEYAVVEGKRWVRYEQDPCVGRVEEMS